MGTEEAKELNRESGENRMTNGLNDYNEFTKKNIHLMVTDLCLRNCEYCCNKQYSYDDIPRVTEAELRACESLFLTGGEPVVFCQPDNIAKYFKLNFPNIKKVIVYANALELNDYLLRSGDKISYIDGFDISVKNRYDASAMHEIFKDKAVMRLSYNRLYLFDVVGFYDYCGKNEINDSNIEIIWRTWQEEFKPAPDSIFRRA